MIQVRGGGGSLDEQGVVRESLGRDQSAPGPSHPQLFARDVVRDGF